MKNKFEKGDLVRVFIRNVMQGGDGLPLIDIGGRYGFIIDFLIDGKDRAKLCLSNGTKTTVLTKDLEKVNDSTV